MALSSTHFDLHPAGLRYLAPALHKVEGINFSGPKPGPNPPDIQPSAHQGSQRCRD